MPHLSRISAEATTEFGYQPRNACGYCRRQRTFAKMGFLPLQYSQWRKNGQQACQSDVFSDQHIMSDGNNRSIYVSAICFYQK